MKKFIVIISLFFAIGSIESVSAQNVNVNVNINLSAQPDWGPVGYDYVEYYYFPDLNIYYDVVNSLFYYQMSNRWHGTHYLPVSYYKYDLYCMYKVVLNESQPWVRNRTHKRAFAHYRGDRTQIVIRHSHSPHYQASRANHRPWIEPNRVDNRRPHQHPHRNSVRASSRNEATYNRPQSTSNGRNTNTSNTSGRRPSGTEASSRSTSRNNVSNSSTNARNSSSTTNSSRSSTTQNNSNNSRRPQR